MASRSLFGFHFFIIHSNDLIFGYCGSIWLTIKELSLTDIYVASFLINSCMLTSFFAPSSPNSFIILVTWKRKGGERKGKEGGVS